MARNVIHENYAVFYMNPYATFGSEDVEVQLTGEFAISKETKSEFYEKLEQLIKEYQI